MKLYHYTTGHKLPLIFASKCLRPSRDGYLWFSSNPTYEFSALKPIVTPNGPVLNLNALQHAVGLYRFVLHAGENKLWQASDVIPRRTFQELDRLGQMMGAKASEWWVAKDFMWVEQFYVERLNDSHYWEQISMKEAVQQFNARNINVRSQYLGEV